MQRFVTGQSVELKILNGKSILVLPRPRKHHGRGGRKIVGVRD